MFAQTPPRRAYACFAVLVSAVAWATIGRAADFGPNPVVGTSNLNITSGDTFTGTMSVGTTGQSGVSLTLLADYSSGQAFAFAGNNSTLTYSSSIHNLTLLSTASLTRAGAGSTTVFDNIINSGAVSATGGTLTFNGSLTNAASGTVSVSGTGASLILTGLANSGTLSASSSGILQFNGSVTTANLGTLTLATGGRALLNGSLTNTAATLSAPSGGSYELNGGTIIGGNVASNALTFTSNGGTLNGVALTGTLNLPTNTNSSVAGNTSFTGAAVTFGQSAYLYLNNTNAALAIDAASTVTGDIRIIDNATGTVVTNQGSITQTNATGGEIYARTVTNSGTITSNAGTLDVGSTNTGYNTLNTATGTITANGATANVNLNGNVANSGILSAQNSGTLSFLGTNITGNLGNVQLASGGRALLKGTLTNTSATLSAPTGGVYELTGGTITGGTVAGNALTFTGSGGTLNGVALTGSVSLPANTNSTVAGNTSFTSAAVTFGQSAYLYLNNPNAALSIVPGSTVTGDIRIIDNATGTVVTNQGTITQTNATGGEVYARSVINSGTIASTTGTLDVGSTSAGYSTVNTGTITANGSAAIVDLNGNVLNSGVLSAQNSGSLAFYGTNTTGNLGNVTLTSGGHAYLKGILDNTSSTLTPPTGGSYELLGGTIIGGTIAGNALTFTGSGGTLNNTSLTGAVTIPASTNSSIAGNVSLTGAAVTFGQSAYLYLNNTNATLAIDAASTVTGDIRIIDNATGSVITNQGIITQTNATGGEVYARTVINLGTITATAGTLDIGATSAGYNTTNTATGTIIADGSGANVNLNGNVANSGILRAQNSGTLSFLGTNTTGNLGNVTLTTGGRAFVKGTLTNTAATLTAPSGGSYELSGGTVTGGTVGSNALTFTNSGGTLNGVTLTGTVNLPANTNSSIAGNVSLTGATVTSGQSAYLYLNSANAILTVDSASMVAGDIRFISDSSSTGTAIANQGTITQSNVTGGELYAKTLTNSGTVTSTAGTLDVGSTSAGFSTVNTATGVIVADGSGANVNLNGTVANGGILRAQNSGTLSFQGTNTTGNLGTVLLATGGRALLKGVLLNTATTLNAPGGGSFELYGGTIVGGTVAGGALTFTSSGGTLNSVSLVDSVTIPANTNSYVNGNSSLTSAIVNFGTNTYLYLTGSNATLTIDPNSTVSGDIQIYSDGSTGTTLTNQGNIVHNNASSGQLYARTLTNSGSINALAGTLTFGTTTSGYNSFNTSTGTITADGSGTTVYISGNVSNQGTLIAQNSGLLRFNGANPTGIGGTVQVSSGGRALLEGTLTNPGTLAVPSPGVYELYGGTIVGGSTAAGALTFTTSGGTLNGVTFGGDIAFPTSSYAYFTGGTTFSGTNATLANNSAIYWQQVGSLTGKALSLANSAYLYVTGANSALTLASTTSLTGDVRIYSDGSTGTAITNQGTLTHNVGTGVLYAHTLTNSGTITDTAGNLTFGDNTAGYNSFNTGTITASGSGATIFLSGNVTNTGTLVAQNSGNLNFSGNNSSGNLGTVQLSTGGRALISGTLSNSAASLATPTGGSFELYGGTIVGGSTAAGALTFTTSGGTLNGVTFGGDIAFPTSSYAYFTGGTTFSGTNATLANNSAIYWQQVGSLTGKALSLANSAYLYVTGANSALTLASTTSLTGDVRIYSDGSTGTAITNQGTLTHNVGTGVLYANTLTNAGSLNVTANSLTFGDTGAGYNSFNTGTITADGGGTTVYLSGNVVNTGTLVAQNSGRLIFNGNTVTANLGNVQLASGGRALISGTLNNNAATLNVPGGGNFELSGGTINGGSITANALGLTPNGGTLNGVTIVGDIGLAASSYATATGGSTFTGANAALAANSSIYWQQVGTLAGKSISMANGAFLYLTGANNSLTLSPTTSVTGDVSIYSDGSSGITINNQGSLTHNLGTGNIYAASVANTGSITATAGNLNLGTNSTGYSFSNAAGGTITVAGGTITLGAPSASPIVNQGTIAVQSGTLQTGGHLINGSGGTISGAGTINGGLTVAGGTLAPGNSIGTLTLTNGAFAITNATVFALELGGTTSDRLVFQNPTGTVNLGAGLLSISLNILSTPTAGTTYNVVQITSGGSGITGTFAGLPTSGMSFQSSYLGTPYNFTVNYQTNLVSLTLAPVPEPSTYALLIAGLGLLVVYRRRPRR